MSYMRYTARKSFIEQFQQTQNSYTGCREY